MAKQSKNLSLDSEAIKRGETYSKLHGTSISRLVSKFLLSLPVGKEDESELSPTVRRLIGAAAGDVDVEDYHKHLMEKYGR